MSQSLNNLCGLSAEARLASVGRCSLGHLADFCGILQRRTFEQGWQVITGTVVVVRCWSGAFSALVQLDSWLTVDSCC